MKVLFFHEDCRTMGGANIYRKELSQALSLLGNEVSLLTFDPDPEETVVLYHYKCEKDNKLAEHFKRRYFNLSLFRALGKIIKCVRPDIIHINSNDLFPNSVLMACGNIPIVQTIHDWKMVCPLWSGITVDGKTCESGYGRACYAGGCISRNRYYSQHFWRKINIFLLKKRMGAIVTPSMALKKALTNYGLTSEHIPNYVGASKFLSSQYNPGTKNVLFAGHLFSSKGVHNLIKAFQKVSEMIPSAKLYIVGDGPEREKLQYLTVSLKIHNSVIFHGAAPHADLGNFYAKANVVVLPSVVAENCPLVVLEAMASARPVIGSRLGGTPELISENENGLLFVPGDTDELGEKIIDLLLDPDRSEKMGRRGRQRIEKEYSYEEHIRRISDLYVRLIKCSAVRHESSCSFREKRQ